MELDLPTISKKIKIKYVSELGMIYYRYFLHSQMETPLYLATFLV